MAGVSVGCALARRLDVAVLEAEGSAPLHTTGRSAAMFQPQFGSPTVRLLSEASRSRFGELEQQLGTPPLLTPREVLYVADVTQEGALEPLFGRGLARLDATEAARRFPALRVAKVLEAAVDTSGSDIDVLALYDAYRRGLKARGGHMVLRSPVIRVERLRVGWRVRTATEEWSCLVIVNAAGAWSDRIASLAGQPVLGLTPLRRSVCIAPVAAPESFRDWPFLEDAEERFYAKPEGAALLCSPADETPEAAGNSRADDLEIARALDSLRELTTFDLRSVRTVWAGQRTFAPDREPVVGESAPGSGFYWCAGQGGYGIQMAPAVADVTASLVLGEELPRPLQPARAKVEPSRLLVG